jgi:hypothetical protein
VDQETFEFDDEWVRSARHHEPSVDDLERAHRARCRQVRRNRRRQRLRALVGVGVMVALGAGLWLLAAQLPEQGSVTSDHPTDHIGSSWITLGGDARPTPARGQGSRILEEIVAADPDAPYTFLETRPDGTPVGYDPCRELRFVVNPLDAPVGYRTVVEEVLRVGEQASGLRLKLVGDSDEEPSTNRNAYQPDRYGNAWAPVLIAWSNETAIPEMAGTVSGLGGSSWTVDDNSRQWLITGLLYLDTTIGDDLEVTRSVLLHELGHVLGLGHVDDDQQIMNASAFTPDLGPGDRAGLAAIGAGPCAGAL